MVREVVRSYSLLLAVPIFFITVAALSAEKIMVIPALFSAFMVGFAVYADSDVEIASDFALNRERISTDGLCSGLLSLKAKGGFGIITVAVPPASYVEGDKALKYKEGLELEKGKASRVFFKGLNDLNARFTVDVKALKRGTYDFGLVTYTYHGLFGGRVIERHDDHGVRLTVLPKYKVVQRGVWRIIPSSVTPRVTPNRLGPYSTDFVAVKEYAPGDPYRFINWKATARSASGQLMVNEFEREGLRNVIFLVDVGRSMRLGFSQENPLELSIPLILSLSKVLLRYGYNVGLWTSPPTGVSVMPSSGQSQFQKVLDATLEVSYWGERGIDLEDAKVLRRVISETRPLLVILTNLAALDDARALKATICANRMETHCRLLSRALLIDTVHDSIIIKKELAAEFPDLKLLNAGITRKSTYELLPQGIKVVTWDPVSERVGGVMARVMPLVRWYA
ncbi:MAG: DUF58 domain-containing protein [Thermoprotei archaeon]